MTKQVTLEVNDNPISLDYFVEGFVDHTVAGIVAALKGAGEIGSLDISIRGETVAVSLNGAPVPTNPFAGKIIRSTIIGMVSTLKGVTGTDRINITIRH